MLEALASLVSTVPSGCRGGEWLAAVQIVRKAEGLAPLPSFDAAVKEYGHENLSAKATN